MAAKLVFRDARNPGVEHVLLPGASGYAEAAAAWRDGRHWLDSATGTFLRDQPSRGRKRFPAASTRQPAARDYLADWRL